MKNMKVGFLLILPLFLAASPGPAVGAGPAADEEERRIQTEGLEQSRSDEILPFDVGESSPLRIRPSPPDKPRPEEMLAFKTGELAESLARDLGGLDSELFVATFADADRSGRSNSFGRFMADSLMERMRKLGFGVLELRISDKIRIQPVAGVHLLSVPPGESAGREVETAVVGTYRKAGDVLEVRATVVSRPTRRVLAAASFEMVVDKGDPFFRGLFDEPIGVAEPAAGKAGR